jgi:hypothetical protein
MTTRRALILFALIAIAIPAGAEYQPPANCVAWFDGCNTCVRVGTEGGACTRKACIDEPQAGYCTRYADGGEGQAPVPGAKPGSASAPTTTTETAPSDEPDNSGTTSTSSPEREPSAVLTFFSWLLDVLRFWLGF